MCQSRTKQSKAIPKPKSKPDPWYWNYSNQMKQNWLSNENSFMQKFTLWPLKPTRLLGRSLRMILRNPLIKRETLPKRRKEPSTVTRNSTEAKRQLKWENRKRPKTHKWILILILTLSRDRLKIKELSDLDSSKFTGLNFQSKDTER